VRRLVVAAALAAGALAPAVAEAQQNTFYLDRLQIGGAPDDTFALWRPQMGEKTRFFGQLAVGFAYRPLRLENVIPDPTARAEATQRGFTTPVNESLTAYLNAGVEVLDRFSLQVALPITAYENGDSDHPTGPQDHAAVNDLRLDSRFILARTTDRFFKFGFDASLFLPTGSKVSYGSDGSPAGLLEVSGELDFKKFFIVADTGPLFRPHNAVNTTGGTMVTPSQIDTQTEWRYGLGGFVPIRDGQFRLGLQIFGSAQIGSATFKQNDPLEWIAEARMHLDKRHQGFVALGGGTRFFPGYSPDFRILAAIGYNFGINDTDPRSPGKRFHNFADHGGDRDHDGVPDDVDLCPDDPGPKENDGCPKLPDRDGDGIPDINDKCPDEPEDFDGIQDADGCPEDDADHDGIPDAQDACPLEPGDPDPDPSKNGCPKYIRRIKGSSEIQILQQIQFETGSAVIKKDSYKILDEVVRLLKVNPEITLLSIEGHTDNRGSDQLNDKLSKARAKSCLDYLVSHGIESKRLASNGFGPTKPIETNDTADGRQKNRRTEFHIRQQDGGKPVGGPGGTPQKGAPPGSQAPTTP
jgi:OOP family OmpA-OmpF porin